VVPVKDVQPFIRTAQVVIRHMPEAEAWIAGPVDEDPGYAAECRSLVASLGLQDKVRFLGFQRLTDLLPKIGAVVLSSITEAQPLVVLEGNAAGIPAVTTDVGACRQLIYGVDEEDCSLGPSGRVVRIADPQGLAEAVLELLGDPGRWQAASDAGIRRIEPNDGQELMFTRYRRLFQEALAWRG
jgi:glycosyltransferase involved in cell wall biosynthesis